MSNGMNIQVNGSGNTFSSGRVTGKMTINGRVVETDENGEFHGYIGNARVDIGPNGVSISSPGSVQVSNSSVRVQDPPKPVTIPDPAPHITVHVEPEMTEKELARRITSAFMRRRRV